jgi:hypothetical protein
MRPLSKEAETKLMAAIEKAASLVNTGEEPNAAIIKVAAAEHIPAGHINIMVHAYNTGRTTSTREKGASANEKAADFKLADADTIIDALFPKVVKTSAALSSEKTISTEYAVSPAGFLSRRKATMEKAAAAITALPEKTYVAPPRDEHAAAMREHSKRAADKLALEEVRRLATVAYSKAANAMDDLATYFRTADRIPFGDVKKEAELRVGAEGVSVLVKLAEVYPWLNKQAATDKNYFGNAAPYALIETVIEKLAEYKEHQAAFNALNPTKKEAAQKPEPTTGSILYNPLEESLELKKASASLSPLPTGPVSMTRQLGENLYTGTSGYFAKNPADLRNEAFDEITDPNHERKLRNIKAQSTLADMITNDPVISGYDPREVTNAFNEISELAPNFADSTAAMQALLRKRLEAGQLADFDVKQLLELEKLKADKQKSMLDTQGKQRELI